MKDVTPDKKMKPIALILEDGKGERFAIDLTKYAKGEYRSDGETEGHERLMLTLWNGSDKFEGFKSDGLGGNHDNKG